MEVLSSVRPRTPDCSADELLAREDVLERSIEIERLDTLLRKTV